MGSGKGSQERQNAIKKRSVLGIYAGAYGQKCMETKMHDIV